MLGRQIASLADVVPKIEEHLDIALFSLRRFHPLFDECVPLLARKPLLLLAQLNLDFGRVLFCRSDQIFPITHADAYQKNAVREGEQTGAAV